MFLENDWMIDFQAGKIPGHTLITALGEREDIQATPQGEDIWRGNDLSVTPITLTSHTTVPTPASVGEQMSVISESDADNGATATGVLTIRIHYLDSEGNDQFEDVTLDGTTEVDTVATDIRFVNDLHSLTVGSNGVCEGNVRIYKKGSPELVYNMIGVGGNKSLVPHRMVPFGKKLLLLGWHGGEVNSKSSVIRIRSTDMHGELMPGVFLFKGTAYVNKNTTGPVPLHALVPALSIVKASIWTSQATGIATGVTPSKPSWAATMNQMSGEITRTFGRTVWVFSQMRFWRRLT